MGKSVLLSDLLLEHFNPTLDTVVAADSSNHGIDVVFSYCHPDGQKKGVFHTSRSLTTAERNYS